MLPIALTFWPFLETLLKNNRNKIISGTYNQKDVYKINANIISGSHAILVIILGSLYLYTKSDITLMCMIVFSSIYFIYDSYSVWFLKIKEYYPYFFHHLASVYFLQSLPKYIGEIGNTMILGFVFLEISNLPSYYIYYFLKTNKEKNEVYYSKLTNLKLGQIGIYVLLRLIAFAFLFKTFYKHITHQPILFSCIVGLYIMGIYWSYQLSLGYLKTKKEYNGMLKNETINVQ